MKRPNLRRTRVRYLAQRTAVTGSDHLALVVDVELIRRAFRKARRKVARVQFATINAGGRFSERALRRLVKVDAPDVVAFQEASDQGWLHDVMLELGYALLTGEPHGQGGQAATPTYVKASRVSVVKPGVWLELLKGGTDVGEGAGPRHSKAKWWLKTWLEVDGIRFGASSWHATASQQNRSRMAAALAEARVWVNVVLLARRPIFTLGDTNSDQDQPLSAWVRRRGVTSNHDQLGEVATHGGRSIDAVDVAQRFVLAS